MSADCLVRVAGLHRRFGPIHAVRDVSFDLRRGEVLGFLGPNGAGKSTTMKMLCGVLAPSAGSVHIEGFDLAMQPREAKQRLGYLPEIPPLYRELSVDEFLLFCARIRRVPDARRAVAEAKDRCGLQASGPRLIRNLSKGYQQRVGIAQAIVHRPAVIVLDEPTSGLDPNQIREIRALIGDLGDERGVIVSTHILPEVSSVCDRVQILHAGRLVLDVPLAELSGRTSGAVLGLRAAPGVQAMRSALAEPAGVRTVEPLGEQRFRLGFAGSGPDLEAVARTAMESGWGLVELTPLAPTLEDVFVSLTVSEEAALPDATAEPGASA